MSLDIEQEWKSVRRFYTAVWDNNKTHNNKCDGLNSLQQARSKQARVAELGRCG